MALHETLLGVVIIVGFGVWIYSKKTGRSLQDLFNEMVESLDDMMGRGKGKEDE